MANLKARNGDAVEEGDKIILWDDVNNNGRNDDQRVGMVLSCDEFEAEIKVNDHIQRYPAEKIARAD